MRFVPGSIEGPCLVELEPIADARGFFARAWCARESDVHGLVSRIAQANLSLSRQKGTIRGMHLQRGLHGEAKFVRCIAGSIFDVAVDVRPDSPSFGRWFGAELSATNRRALYVPPGFAHGFQTLEDDCEALYLVSEFYAPGAEAGLHHADPDVGIEWPLPVAVVSERDSGLPGLEAFREAKP